MLGETRLQDSTVRFFQAFPDAVALFEKSAVNVNRLRELMRRAGLSDSVQGEILADRNRVLDNIRKRAKRASQARA